MTLQYKHDGPKQPIKDMAIYIKSLSKIAGKDVLPGVKLSVERKTRGPDLKDRVYAEALFRKEAIAYLKKRGCILKRIENSIAGKTGRDVPDYWVFNPSSCYATWVELKSLTGSLSPGQVEFLNYCCQCHINHIVARTLQDFDPIFKNIKPIDLNWEGEKK